MTTTQIDIPAALMHLDHAVHRNELKNAGYSMAQIRAAERAGKLAQFRSEYFGPPDIAAADHRTQLIAAIGAQLRGNPGLVVGGRTAAQLHGWSTAQPRPYSYYDDAIEFRDYREHPKAFKRKAACNVVDDRPRTVILIDGIEVTSVARTLVDLVRSREPSWPGNDTLESFIVLGDRLLYQHVTTVAELEAEVALLSKPEAGRVRAALGQLDGRAQNATQSRSRLALARLQLPKPELCVDIVDDDGTVIATPPFVWPDYRVIGFSEEVDVFCDFDRRLDECTPHGYRDRHHRHAHDVPDDPDRKDRCDVRNAHDNRFRALGYTVFRWTDAKIDRYPCDPCHLRRALRTPLPEPAEDCFGW